MKLKKLKKKIENKDKYNEEEEGKEIIYYSDSIKNDFSLDTLYSSDLDFKYKSVKNFFEKENEEQEKLLREEKKKRKRKKKKINF